MKTLVIILSVSLISAVIYFSMFRDLPFDSTQWKLGHTGGTIGSGVAPYRHIMVSDLLSSYDLVGKKKSYILELLGQSMNPESFDSDSKMVYWLNEDYRGFDIDPVSIKFLEISFNGSTVTAVELRELNNGM